MLQQLLPYEGTVYMLSADNDDLQALDTQDQTFVIAAGAEWFKLGGQSLVTLETRIPLRRLLLALGELKMRDPNGVLPVTAAFEAGWPGERATPAAAAMRVYTAVHSLRRMGLKGMLVRRSRGYTLNVAVHIAASESQFPPAMPPIKEDGSIEILAAEPVAQSA